LDEFYGKFYIEAMGDFTFWAHMEPSYMAVSMASYTEALGNRWEIPR